MELPRHVEGREAFGAFVDQWISASTLTTPQFARLANACLGCQVASPGQPW